MKNTTNRAADKLNLALTIRSHYRTLRKQYKELQIELSVCGYQDVRRVETAMARIAKQMAKLESQLTKIFLR